MECSVRRTAIRLTVALVVVGLAVALLVGCGSSQQEAGPADDQTSSQPSDEPSENLPNGPIDFTQIAMVSESNVDGTVSPRAVVLDSEASVQEFAGQFTGDQMGQALAREYASADVPEGELLVASVVDISCQAPTEVRVKKTDGGVRVTAAAQASKVQIQCLVPVTTVALVSVPEAAV
jgi:hypothetical protein